MIAVMLGSVQMVKCLAALRLNHKTGTDRRWQTPQDLISHPAGGGGGGRLLGCLSWAVRKELTAAYMAGVDWTTGAVAVSLDNLRQQHSFTGNQTMTLVPSSTWCLFSTLTRELGQMTRCDCEAAWAERWGPSGENRKSHQKQEI